MDVVADFSRFATQFQRDLNAALRGIRIDMSGTSGQISNGVRQGVNAAGEELRRLGPQAGEAMNAVAQQANRAGQSMAASFSRAGREMSNIGDQMSMMVSLPIAAAGAATIRTAGNFEQAMNKVKAATEAVGPAFTDLRELAIQLGSTTKFSATEAAYAMNELATAGFGTQQIMAALPGVLDMAAAGSVDLATAAEIGAGILNGFGFAASDLGAVNDILARTFLSTATTLSSLGESFKYVGPTAKSAGLSFTEVSAAIGLLGNAGIKGSMAGTALNASISRLLKPTGDVAAKLQELGVTVTGAGGKMLPLVDILRQLEQAGADTADMITLFGLEAGPDMTALLAQGSGALANLDAQLRNASGTAGKVAKTQMEGLNGSLDELSSSVEGLMIAIGDAGLLAILTRLVKGLTSLVTKMGQASPTFLSMATVVAVVVAAAGPFLAVAGRMVTMIGSVILSVQKFWAWIVRLAPALTGMGGPIAWVIAGIVALGIALTVAYQKSATFRNIVQQAMRAVGSALSWLGGVAQQALSWLSARAATAGTALVGLWNQARPVILAIGGAFRQVWQGAIRPALQGIGNTLQQTGSAVASFWSGTLQPVVAQIVGFFGRLAEAVRSWWAGNGDTVMRAAASVFSWLGGVATTVFSGVMAVLSGVAKIISWVITTVAIPLFKVLVSVWTTVVSAVMALQPVWTILGAIIGAAIAVVIGVVKVLWSVISVVFSAIVSIVKVLWSVISTVFSVIGSIIQGFVAVITWMWGIIQPVIMAIVNIVAAIANAFIWVWQNGIMPAIQGIVAAVTWLWNAIQTVVGVIAQIVRTIGDAFMWVWNSVIMPAVQGIIAAVMWLADTFGPIFSAIGNLIATIWSGVISIVFDLFRLGFEMLVAGAQVFWSLLEPIFNLIGSVIMAVWSGVIKPVLDAFGAAFSWLWGIIQTIISAIGTAFSWLGGIAQSVINAIVGAFLWLWSGIQMIGALIGAVFSLMGSVIQMVVDAIVAGFTWLWNMAVSIFNGIVNAVRSAVSGVEQGAAGFANFVNNVSSYFESMVNAVRSRISAMIDAVRNLPSSISNLLSNLGNLLYNAGQNIINGLINGFNSKLGDLRERISSAASSIRDFFPFSPAKTGPLSGRGDPTIAGAKIITMLASGIEDSVPTLQAMADQAAGLMLSTLTPELPPVPTLAMPATPRAERETAAAATPPTTIYLTVQSLDPRESATLVMDAISTYERTNGKGWRR